MSKAVIVMDMPKSCNKCKFFNSQYQYCDLKGLPLKRKDGKYGRTKISRERADWCPLRELPEKKPKQVPVAYSYFGAYNNGWIPCSERLPETDKYILLSFSNFSVPCVGRYETDDENGGAFYIGDEAESCSEQDMFVNAWMPLPEPYKKGE